MAIKTKSVDGRACRRGMGKEAKSTHRVRVDSSDNKSQLLHDGGVPKLPASLG